MVGKMILPLLGGTPAVWSTCMVFFQAALLGGYAYAHASTAWLGLSRQMLLHMALLALPVAVLPLAVNPALLHGGETNPVLDVLLLLSFSVGLPFLVLAVYRGSYEDRFHYQMYKGLVTEPVLEGLRIPYHVVDDVGDASIVGDAVREADLGRKPVVLLFRRAALLGDVTAAS